MKHHSRISVWLALLLAAALLFTACSERGKTEPGGAESPGSSGFFCLAID